MKTKYWIILLALVLVLSLGLSFWLLRPKAPEKTVTVVQDGIVTQVLELSENQIEDDAENNGEHKESHDFQQNNCHVYGRIR